MNRYEGNILAAISGQSAVQFAQSYTVYVTPVGARVSQASTGSTVTLDRGHSFRVGDKFLLNPGSDNTYSGAEIDSINPTNNTITFASATFNLVAGDVLVNLGPDTGPTAPEYDAIPMGITDQPDGGGIFATPSVDTDEQGNFEFYHRGDGKFWLLILDSAGTPTAVQQGVGGMSRNNICDYGAKMDGSTDDHDRIVGAIVAVPDNGGEVFAPAGDIYLADDVEVTRGAFTYRCDSGARFVIDGNGVKVLYVNATSTVYDVKVFGMWGYDPDPPNHVGSEESHGIWLANVHRADIVHCKFDSIGDESIQIGTGCDHVMIDSCVFIDGSHEATDGGTINFNNCDGATVQNCRFYNNQSGPCILVTCGTAGSTDHIQIKNNYIDTTNDVKATGADGGSAIAVNAGAQAGTFLSIDGNHIKDPFAMGITVNTTGGGSFAYIGIRNNTIEGGGDNASAAAKRGAINVAAASNYGLISGNVISDWGDTAAQHSGIRVNLDGFVIIGNSIFGTTNNTYCIYSAGSGSTGNFIDGNISEKPIYCDQPDTLGINKISATNVTTLADEATPSVRGGHLFTTAGTANDPITNFDDGVVGQEIIIRAAHAIRVDHDVTKIWLNLGVNYTMEVGSTLTLRMFAADIWTEVARSDNVA